jgi:hypothetical protein
MSDVIRDEHKSSQVFLRGAAGPRSSLAGAATDRCGLRPFSIEAMHGADQDTSVSARSLPQASITWPTATTSFLLAAHMTSLRSERTNQHSGFGQFQPRGKRKGLHPVLGNALACLAKDGPHCASALRRSD